MISTVYENETFEFEVGENGEMIITNVDMEQDDMLIFMTGQESNARLLMKHWNSFDHKRFWAVDILIEDSDIAPEYFAHLTLDIAEHTLFALESEYKIFTMPREALAMARHFLGSRRKHLGHDLKQAIKACDSNMERVKEDYREFINVRLQRSRKDRTVKREIAQKRVGMARSSLVAVNLALDGVEECARLRSGAPGWSIAGVAEDIEWASGAARGVMSDWAKIERAKRDPGFVTASHSNWNGFFDIEEELEKEHAWQMRRLGYTLKQFQAGKPWPGMSETK